VVLSVAQRPGDIDEVRALVGSDRGATSEIARSRELTVTAMRGTHGEFAKVCVFSGIPNT
jgi:hypothetical protein